MTKVLLFDFDGTIADSFENFLGIVAHLSQKHHLQVLTREQLETLRTEDPRNIIKQLKIPLYKLPLLAQDMKKMQREQIHTIRPFPGLPEVLRTLKSRGFTLGIITSNGKENVEAFLKLHDLEVFDYIQSDSSMFGKDKAIRNFRKKQTLSKEDVIYVGDEIRDIEACKKAGIKIIAVTWGFNTEAGLKKYHPDYLIHNPSDILTIV